MRLLSHTQWPTLLFLGVLAGTLAGCSSDKKTPLPKDSLALPRNSDLGAAMATHDTATRDPNLGPPLSAVPDTNGGVTPGADATLKTYTLVGVGTYITDGVGKALYVFDRDKGGTSDCLDNCALAFPPAWAPDAPVTVGLPLHKDMLANFLRTDTQRRQLTYNGMPLYYYTADRAEHATMGKGLALFGGHWALLAPDGKPFASVQ